jgi:hypothetical protein
LGLLKMFRVFITSLVFTIMLTRFSVFTITLKVFTDILRGSPRFYDDS